MATENQIKTIRSISSRILAVDVTALQTKERLNKFSKMTCNPQANAIAAQTMATELLDRLGNEDLSIGTASAWISDLQTAARRARA